jgi:hypothetical protein
VIALAASSVQSGCLPAAESITGGWPLVARCPHCERPVQLAKLEGDAVQIVRQDGSRAPVQTHFTQPDAPEAQWTLHRWWTERVKPEMVAEGKSADRISQYETYLRRWNQCCLEHWTNYPVLQTISPATLSQFRAYVISKKLTSGAQADKHISGISTLLRRAEKAWILPRVATLPAAHRGEKTEGLKFRFTLAEIDSMLRAAVELRDRIWPRAWVDGRACREPDLWWRAYFIGGWNYGFRPQEWWSYERSMHALRWSGVIFDANLEIDGRDYHNEHGWVRWQQDKTGHVLTLPMNATVSRYMRGLWESLTSRQQRDASTGSGRRVWDFPCASGTAKPGRPPTLSDGFYAAYWAIVEAAGISPKLDAEGTRLTHRPSHFRKTAHTEHRDRIGNAADWITGHRSGKSIGERNYYVAIDKVTESILAHPQPPSA